MTIEEILEGNFIRAKSKEYLDAIEISLGVHYKSVRNEKELDIYETYLRCTKQYILERKLG